MSPERGIAYRQVTDVGDELLASRLFEAQGAIREAETESQSADSVLLGAFQGGRLIGATASRMAPDNALPARVEDDCLHVTRLAVEEASSGRGIGGGLMRLQRLLAVQRGMRLVTWEEDMLDGRLAHLAIHKLGAVSRSLSAVAGAGATGILNVEWWVSSPRVKSRLSGGRPELDLAHALDAGAPKLNAGWLDDDGLLRPTGGAAPPSSATALVEVPHDIRALQARNPELAVEWRAHLAHILAQAFAQGYWLTDHIWLRGERVPRAYYLLIDGERTLG